MRLLLRSLAALSGSHEGLDGERDAFGFKVGAEDLDLDDLSGFDGLGGILDEAVGELADVDEAVLMDADVDEGAELGDVGDDAFEDHAGLNVGELADVIVEVGGDELVAWIAAGLAELFENVVDGEGARRRVLCVDFGEELRALDELGDGGAERIGRSAPRPGRTRGGRR